MSSQGSIRHLGTLQKFRSVTFATSKINLLLEKANSPIKFNTLNYDFLKPTITCICTRLFPECMIYTSTDESPVQKNEHQGKFTKDGNTLVLSDAHMRSNPSLNCNIFVWQIPLLKGRTIHILSWQTLERGVKIYSTRFWPQTRRQALTGNLHYPLNPR